MKKIFLILLLFIVFVQISAQKKDIRLNVGFQFALPERLFHSEIANYNDKNMGGGFHLMPTWNYNRNWQLGLNFEYNFVTENYTTDAIRVYDVVSVLPTVNYFLGFGKIRPYLGMGAGLYSIIYSANGVKFGIRPLIACSFYDFFHLSAEYSKFFGNTGIPDESDFGNYYFAIKASFSIGLKHSKKFINLSK